MSKNIQSSGHRSSWRLLSSLILIVVAISAPFSDPSPKAIAAQTTASVRLNSSTIVRGQTGTVTVDLIALGGANRENAVSFTVVFDPTQLSFVSAVGGSSGTTLFANTSQAGIGMLGILSALGSGSVFPAGTNQIAVITFKAVATGTLPLSAISFGDSPIPRELASDIAELLPANWLGGTITVLNSPEADVAPRPNGSASVVVSDWVQVGRFSVGLDTATVGSEFQRADCAPRETQGDGQISVADWVQAGRYSVGLDPPVLAGGPTSPPAIVQPEPNGRVSRNNSGETRVVRVVKAEFEQGQIGVLQIELDAFGNENALGFTLSYDADKATFVGAMIAPHAATDAKLLVNPRQAGKGHVAIAIALTNGRTFLAGKHRLVSLRFVPKMAAGPTLMDVRFDDRLITREIVSSDAKLLTDVTYADATVNIAGSALATISNASHRSR